MARFKPVSYIQTLMVPIVLEKQLVPGTLEFAIHFLEYGTDLRYIQELLGHKSSKTTVINSHITHTAKNKIVSPLDILDIEIDNIEKKIMNNLYAKYTQYCVNPTKFGGIPAINCGDTYVSRYKEIMQ